MKKIIGYLMLLTLIFSFGCAKDSTDPIKIPTHNWSSQIVGAHILKGIFEAKGNSVEIVNADSQKVYADMCEGKIALVHEVWQSAFGKSFNIEVEKGCVLDVSTHDAITLEDMWYPAYVKELCPGLPDYKAIDKCVSSVLEGPKPWHGDLMPKRFKALGIKAKVKYAKSAADLFGSLAEAAKNKKPIIIFNWTPNFTDVQYGGEFVKFPPYYEGCRSKEGKGGDDKCGSPIGWLKMAAWSGFSKKWPNAYKTLQKINFNATDIASQSVYTDNEGLSVEDAAQKWLAVNCDRWTKWAKVSKSSCPKEPNKK